MINISIAPIRCAICAASLDEFSGRICSVCRCRVCSKHSLKAFLKARGTVCSRCLDSDRSAK